MFHAGTAEKDGIFISTGGRVAVVVAMKETLEQAQQVVYQYIKNMALSEYYFYRNDIGQKAIRFINQKN